MIKIVVKYDHIIVNLSSAVHLKNYYTCCISQAKYRNIEIWKYKYRNIICKEKLPSNEHIMRYVCPSDVEC